MTDDRDPRPVVGAVMSCFRPDTSILANLQLVRDQVDHVVVVDDGSGSAYDGILDLVADAGVTVVRLEANSGIATALNRGITAVIAAGATDVIAFDQDSTVPPDFVGGLLRARTVAEMVGVRVGMVVPERFANVSQVASRSADGIQFARNSIQSGMLVRSEVFDSVGLLRDEFFIDLVDTEFEMRVKAAGYAAVAAPGVALAHRIGRQYERRLFGVPLRVLGLPRALTLSTPFRYYYRVRNRRVLARESFRSTPALVIRDTAIDALHFIEALSAARPRRTMWRVYRTALRDARTGRMGRIAPALSEQAAQISWRVPEVSDA